MIRRRLGQPWQDLRLAWCQIGIQGGLPADDVTAVLEDGPSDLWVATRGGLADLRLAP